MTPAESVEAESAGGTGGGFSARLTFTLALLGTLLGAMNSAWNVFDGLRDGRTKREQYIEERFYLGREALRTSDRGIAEHQLALAESEDKEHPKVKILRSLVYHANGQVERAISLAEGVRKDHANFIEARLVLGDLYLIEGDYSRAKECLVEALQIESANLTALNTLGLVSLEEGDLVAAEEAFRSVLDAQPHDSRALGNLCIVYAKQQVEGALETCEKAVKADPTDAILVGNLGLLYYFVGDWGRAESTLRQAKELNPQDHWVDDALSLVARAQGNAEEAAERLHRGEYFRELFEPAPGGAQPPM